MKPLQATRSTAGTLLPFLALVLALSLLPDRAQAQGYWIVYPSDCPAVCSPAAGVPPSLSTCVSQCQNCLLTWGCYSTFYPIFALSNGSTVYYSRNCMCYWPWWSWLILAVGLFVICFICLPVLCICCCTRMFNKDKGPPPPQPWKTAPPPAAP